MAHNLTDSQRDRQNILNNRYALPIAQADAGLVEMTQPISPRSPTQKYRLRDLADILGVGISYQGDPLT